jgi:hypothetical protein
MLRFAKFALIVFTGTCLAWAQEPNPAQKPGSQLQPEPGMPTPIFRIQVVSRSTPAVNYLHRGGATKIDFDGTPLMADGKGGGDG